MKSEATEVARMGIEVTIPLKDVADLLCSALEGGSNYWYEIVDYREPARIEFQMAEDRVFWHIDYPLNPGGSVLIRDMEGDEEVVYVLNLQSIRRGLEVMSDKYRCHWSDFTGSEYDAITGDVFLQCCLFGDIIYG